MTTTLPDLLAQVRVELDKSTTADNAVLHTKLDAAWAEIEDCIGHVVDVTATDVFDIDWSTDCVVLTERPVLAVTSVQLLRADGTVAQDLGVGTDASASGVLYGLPEGRVRVTYTAGRDPITADIIEAAVQLAAHLFRQSRALKESGQIRADVAMGPGMSSAMPNKVRELLKLRGRAARSRVLVGGGT